MIIDNLVAKNGESKCSAFRSCRDFHATHKMTKKVFVDPSGSASGINAYKVECNQIHENCTELITPEVTLLYHKSIPYFMPLYSIERPDNVQCTEETPASTVLLLHQAK